MVLEENFRTNYAENISEGKGPLPPGMGRGFYFEPDLFWPLPNFLTESGLDFLRAKASSLLESAGLRKDFNMQQSEGTPRHLRVVPGTVINKEPELVQLYHHPELLEFLGDITSSKVVPYPDPLENIVITSLERAGDTHGKHLDVPPLALIMCLEAPVRDDLDKRVDVRDAEGEVWQSILGTDDPSGMLAFDNVHGDRQLHNLQPGDGYILRSDVLPHEVFPLSGSGLRRTILNFTYGIEGHESKQDGSAVALFTA